MPPTSHVVAVENVLRADEPRPSLPRDVALASAPGPGARAASACPAPARARGMSDPLALTAAEAVGAVRAGELDAGELWTAYRERAAAATS